MIEANNNLKLRYYYNSLAAVHIRKNMHPLCGISHISQGKESKNSAIVTRPS